jgi:hypothetical protein
MKWDKTFTPYFHSWEFYHTRLKVNYYYDCNIIQKIVFTVLHGRSFKPTKSEEELVDYYYNSYYPRLYSKKRRGVKHK